MPRQPRDPARNHILLMLALSLAACAPISPPAITDTPVGGPGATDTPAPPTPAAMCTPPLCWSNEVYYCPGGCPGGCGTLCATFTPDMSAPPSPTFPPPEALCSPLLPPGTDPAEPAVAVCVDRASLQPGEAAWVVAEARNIDQAIFSLRGRDGEGYGGLYLMARAEDQTAAVDSSSAVVKLGTTRASGPRLAFVLQASRPGEVVVELRAHGVRPGLATPEYAWALSTPLTITVAP